MADLYVVFLAGSIASGKSSVAALLEEQGATRIDLDVLSREILAVGSPLLVQIQSLFGEDVVDASTGELNRALLASRVFGDPASLERLEALEIPAIVERLCKELDQHASEQAATRNEVCVVEIPLLDRMEEYLSLADEVLVVVAPYEVKQQRALSRGMTQEDFELRLAQQPSDEYLCALADSVIDNSGSYEDLKQATSSWWNTYIANHSE